MADLKKELVELLNRALELEHAARVQYLSHAELITGPNAEKIIERLKEIASDEETHAAMFRELIGSYLGGIPSMGMAETHKAAEQKQIFEINLKGEMEAISFYKEIYRKIVEQKKELPYSFEKFEHQLRHIIIDEEEHVVELNLLLGK